MEQGKLDASEHKDEDGNPDPIQIDYDKGEPKES